MLSQSSFRPAPIPSPEPLRLYFPRESPDGTRIPRSFLLFSFPFRPHIPPSGSKIRRSELFPVHKDTCTDPHVSLLPCTVRSQTQADLYCCTEPHPRKSAPDPASGHPGNPALPENPENRDPLESPALPDPAVYRIPALSFSAFPAPFHSAEFSVLSGQASAAVFPDPAQSCSYRRSSVYLLHLPHRPLSQAPGKWSGYQKGRCSGKQSR